MEWRFSPLGPLMAKIFVGFREKQLFDRIDKTLISAMPTILLRHYLRVVKRKSFSHIIMISVFCLKYIMEVEENNHLP